MKLLVFASLLSLSLSHAFAYSNLGGGVLQSDGSAADTQAAINAAVDGNTILIPAGNFDWTTKVTVTKGVKLQGAGAGGLMACSKTSNAIGTGSRTFALFRQGYLNFSVGQTVQAIAVCSGVNSMTGTVTAISASSVTINVTSTTGSGTWLAWTFATPASTVIANSTGSVTLQISNTSPANYARVSGIQFVPGSSKVPNDAIRHMIIYPNGIAGKTAILSDCRFSGNINQLRIYAVNGLIYRCSFDCGFYSGGYATGASGYGNDTQALQFKGESEGWSWVSNSTLGAADVNGLQNFYVEDCYFAGMALKCMDLDDNSRVVVRRNIFDQSGFATHGPDSSTYGSRHFEIYDNSFVYSVEGTAPNYFYTYNINWWFWIRGGSGVITNNDMPAIAGTSAWGTRLGSIRFSVLNLQRKYGPYGCWTTYPSPHQVGWGYENGQAALDPLYIWNNTGTGINSNNFAYGDDTDQCGNGLKSSQFVLANRDYFYGTAKPGYTKFTFPHPLRTDAVPQAPVITSLATVTGSLGQAFIYAISATGNPTSFSATGLPSGLSINMNTGLISGTPLAAGTSNVTIAATNAQGTGSATLVLTVSSPTPPSITSALTATTAVGTVFTYTITATGSPTTYGASGLPPGLSLNTSTGVISGTPTAAGSSNLTISATNSSGSDFKTLILNISGGLAPTITGHPQSSARTVGQSADFSISTTGTAPISYQWQKNQINISGATSQTYSIPSVQQSHAGNYRCVATNSFGFATSAEAALTVSEPVAGANYYVDSFSGSDTNPGTTTSPWQRCPGMVGWSGTALLQPGDTVYFNRARTWNISGNASGPGLDLKQGVHYIGNQWNPAGGGTTRAILRATGRHETGVVRCWEDHSTIPTWFEGFEIDANGQRTNLIDINHSYWKAGLTDAVKRIENCVAHGNTGNGAENDYKYGIIISDHSLDGSGQVANVEVLNTVVYDVARDGICLYPGANGIISNILIRGCEVFNTGTDPSYTEGHGIVMKGNVKNSVIEYCYSHDVKAAAVFVGGPEYGTGPGPSNSVIRHNILQTVDDNGVIRFYGTGAKSVDVVGNIVLQNEAAGGLNFANNSGTIATKIYNNTFYNAFVDIRDPASSGTIEFRNNIIYEIDDTPLVDSGSDITAHSNNLYYRTSSGPLARVGSTDYFATTVATWESTARLTDPLFKNPSILPIGFAGVFGNSLAPNRDGLSLQSGSPALNAGSTLGAGYSGSINSKLRPQDTSWDIGAYEGFWSAAPSAPTNLRIVTQ